MRVRVAVHIQHRHHEPVDVLGQLHDRRISGGQQLVQQPGGRCRGNPLACMDVRVDEDGRIAGLVRQTDGPDGAVLVRQTDGVIGEDGGMLDELGVEPSVDFVVRVVGGPVEGARRLALQLFRLFVVDEAEGRVGGVRSVVEVSSFSPGAGFSLSIIHI